MYENIMKTIIYLYMEGQFLNLLTVLWQSLNNLLEICG
jgi:hypothetical protein